MSSISYCKLQHFTTIFLCPDFPSPNQTKLSFKSIWSKQASCWSVLITSPCQGSTTSPKQQIITSDPMPGCREGGAVVRFFFFRVCNYCIQSCSNHNSPSHTILDHVHLLPFPLLLGTLQWRSLFFQTHWQNICSVSALLLGLFYYIHLEINHHNSSSQNKQIFAVAYVHTSSGAV